MNGSKQIARAIISKILPHIFRRKYLSRKVWEWSQDYRTCQFAESNRQRKGIVYSNKFSECVNDVTFLGNDVTLILANNPLLTIRFIKTTGTRNPGHVSEVSPSGKAITFYIWMPETISNPFPFKTSSNNWWYFFLERDRMDVTFFTSMKWKNLSPIFRSI